MKKLAGGLARAAQKEAPTGLAQLIGQALSASSVPTTLLLANRDTTALAFASAWKGSAFDAARERSDVQLQALDSASHSFADTDAKAWLREQIEAALTD